KDDHEPACLRLPPGPVPPGASGPRLGPPRGRGSRCERYAVRNEPDGGRPERSALRGVRLRVARPDRGRPARLLRAAEGGADLSARLAERTHPELPALAHGGPEKGRGAAVAASRSHPVRPRGPRRATGRG